MTDTHQASIQEFVPLAPLTTFHIGGIARWFMEAATTDMVIAAYRFAIEHQIPWYMLAGGSNIVFTQEHLHAIVIRVATAALQVNDHTITVDAGVPLATVIETAIAHGLSGLEALSGIPGTIGGAIVGNAGAYGHATYEAVQSVTIFDGLSVQTLNFDQCRFSYRQSIFKQQPWIVLSATLHFQPGKQQELHDRSRQIIAMRNAKYPPGIKTAGSFFKNIPVSSLHPEQLQQIDASRIIDGKVPTGYLLDTVQARGMRVGDICVSDFHGNLLLNIGNGTAGEVHALSQLLQEKVHRHFGIALEEEVRFLPHY